MRFTDFGVQLFNNKLAYPARYQPGNLARIVFILFVLIFVTLYLFKPFTVNIAEQRFNYLTTCFLHALLPAVIIYSYFNLLTRFRNKNPLNPWTLKKELLHVTFLFLLIGLSAFLLRNIIYTNPDNVSWYYLWVEIRNAYLSGTVCCFYLITARVYYNSTLGKSNKRDTITATSAPATIDLTASAIFIKAHVKVDDFYFKPDDLLFAKADGNYVTLTLIKDGLLKNELKRISLKQLELQLIAYPYLIRCHRAYLLNIRQVVKFSGNSQGYIAAFDGAGDKVPVSRAYIDIFDRVYKQFSIV